MDREYFTSLLKCLKESEIQTQSLKPKAHVISLVMLIKFSKVGGGKSKHLDCINPSYHTTYPTPTSFFAWVCVFQPLAGFFLSLLFLTCSNSDYLRSIHKYLLNSHCVSGTGLVTRESEMSKRSFCPQGVHSLIGKQNQK